MSAPVTIEMQGYVYVLTHARHPGLVKIGQTTRTPQQRVKEMSTGSPDPFHVAYAVRVNAPMALERALHADFARFKVGEAGSRGGQEWFQVSAAEVRTRIGQRVVDIRKFENRVAAQKQFAGWWKQRFDRFENRCMAVAGIGALAVVVIAGAWEAVSSGAGIGGLIGLALLGLLIGAAPALFAMLILYGLVTLFIKIVWRRDIAAAQQACAQAHGVKWSDPLPASGQIFGNVTYNDPR